jgi:hypothetical protein
MVISPPELKDIHLTIPSELIDGNAQEINYSLIDNKTIVGLCGYSKSGKDTIGNLLVSKCGFHRISFGDVLKKYLNEFFVESVSDDLDEKGIFLSKEKIDFLNPESPETKELLRPYMIWFGERMKELNGEHHWTNRAFQNIGEYNKIVITDVRRINELSLFEKNRERHNKMFDNRREIGMPFGPIEETVYDANYESLLIFINQLSLTDTDQKTLECVIKAQEEWMFDYTVHVDSRIPNISNYREKHMLKHLRKLVKTYPEYLI